MAATATAPAETRAAFTRRQVDAQVADEAVPPNQAMLDMIEPAIRSTIKMVCPYKALEKQKCFMRHKMRKPADMKIRIFVNHLHQINFDELPQFPPFATGWQELYTNELLDIILFGIPKSCVKEMDKQDFNPFVREDIQMLISFCERMESVEDFHDNNQKSGSIWKTPTRKWGFLTTKGNPLRVTAKWCKYHETNMLNTSKCLVLKKMKEGGRNNSSNKKPFNKNKTWTEKSDDAKKFSKKELNALVKKASEKAVKKATKEMNAVAKHKQSNGKNDSTSPLHMLEN
jgi:hypothetical protein